MRKNDIIHRAAKDSGVTEDVARRIVNRFFLNMIPALATGERVWIRGFGSIVAKVSQPRMIKLPKAERQVLSKPRVAVYFTAHGHLSRAIQEAHQCRQKKPSSDSSANSDRHGGAPIAP